jgi:hypothetical protein
VTKPKAELDNSEKQTATAVGTGGGVDTVKSTNASVVYVSDKRVGNGGGVDTRVPRQHLEPKNFS